MLQLQRHSQMVITDSGGSKKEAFFNGVPCVTLRDVTEWKELVEIGWNRLVPPNCSVGIANVVSGMTNPPHHPKDKVPTPYGNGTAYTQIAEKLTHW